MFSVIVEPLIRTTSVSYSVTTLSPLASVDTAVFSRIARVCAVTCSGARCSGGIVGHTWIQWPGTPQSRQT